MKLLLPELELRLRKQGLWPESRMARIGCYLAGLAVLLFMAQSVAKPFRPAVASDLGGWVTFVSILAVFFLLITGFRWLRANILWRLRNRLIVTYVFVGFIPTVLLISMGLITIYLFAGQFASFIVTSEINSQMRTLESANAAIANELAAKIERGDKPTVQSLEGLRRQDEHWLRRSVCAWYGNKQVALCADENGEPAFPMAAYIKGPFREVVQDGPNLYMRTATLIRVRSQMLYVISSEGLDKDLMADIAKDLGEITLYVRAPKTLPGLGGAPGAKPSAGNDKEAKDKKSLTIRETSSGAVLENGAKEALTAEFTVGKVALASAWFDRQITFGTPLPVMDWKSGEHNSQGAVVGVQTRPSVLYQRLFAALGKFAQGVEYILLGVAVFLAIIELFALFIGGRLTRTITGAVAQLYEATLHINRGDFSHRIPVRSSDQLSTLANSFNSMTASIERLVLEQKEKQRLENELAIAQEVQAQLFPREITQLEGLEVHGFCRPARTVSGDYYDFLAVNSSRMILAVGDISGKGISAALLMATIHSAVRAYSTESAPRASRALSAGAASGGNLMLASEVSSTEISPGALLALLNHQLYESTPTEKYATLFLAVYDVETRRLTYSNGGHLPPIIVARDGSIRRLECGGTVVGLFDHETYPEASVSLEKGDLLLAYSDGVTEPENDYGEFGEERLIDLVRANRQLDLTRLSETVTGAVDDWIGDNEQPDDVTLVFARPR